MHSNSRDKYLILLQLATLTLSFIAMLMVAQIAFADPSPLPSPGMQVMAIASTGNVFTHAWAWLRGTGGMALLGVLLVVSEALPTWFPNLKANSVYQLVVYGLQKIDSNKSATSPLGKT